MIAYIQVAAVPPELSDEPVRTFGSFTADIKAMANWLVSVGITTVAMESLAGGEVLHFRFEARPIEFTNIGRQIAKNPS